MGHVTLTPYTIELVYRKYLFAFTYRSVQMMVDPMNDSNMPLKMRFLRATFLVCSFCYLLLSLSN